MPAPSKSGTVMIDLPRLASVKDEISRFLRKIKDIEDVCGEGEMRVTHPTVVAARRACQDIMNEMRAVREMLSRVKE